MRHSVSMRRTPQRLYFVGWTGGGSSGSPFVCGDLLQAFDAILGEGRDATLVGAVDVRATVFGEQVDLEFHSQSWSSPNISAT
jgi:hypothetical protein